MKNIVIIIPWLICIALAWSFGVAARLFSKWAEKLYKEIEGGRV